ncbi:MAG: hypothetical protein QM504_06815 [Pseudomonadota bacterium]
MSNLSYIYTAELYIKKVTKLISDLDALDQAHKKVNSLWIEYDVDDPNHDIALTSKYPFNLSFDDMGAELSTWVNNVKKNLNDT